MILNSETEFLRYTNKIIILLLFAGI